MRVSGRSAENAPRHCTRSHVGKRISTAIRISASQPFASSPAACSSRAASPTPPFAPRGNAPPPRATPARAARRPPPIVDQRLAAAIEHLTRRRKDRSSTADLEHLDPEQLLQPLDRICERGLTFVKRFPGLGVAARFYDRDQRRPLVERDLRDRHISFK